MSIHIPRPVLSWYLCTTRNKFIGRNDPEPRASRGTQALALQLNLLLQARVIVGLAEGTQD